MKLNVTALMTLAQVREVVSRARRRSAGVRLGLRRPHRRHRARSGAADGGRGRAPAPHPKQQLIWASPRELLNIFQADAIGCHIITVTNDVLKKLPLVGKDLTDYSLDTVKMFHNDATQAGFRL